LKGRSRGGGRRLGVRVRTARGRKASSTRWLQRQLNDPFVTEALRRGYRSRAAFKLLEIDEKFRLLKPGRRVVDLGAAPGGWTQVAAAAIHAGKGGGKLVAVDVLEMEPVAGAALLRRDILDAKTPAAIEKALGGAADVVLCDIAGNTTGHRETDHLRSVAVCEAAHDFARGLLAAGGAFVVKMIQGGGEKDFETALRADFAAVKRFKPKASRPESAEVYFVATGFRGRA
jgi:23S rRNA (uridine2552-2'-O)-methyltransferase